MKLKKINFNSVKSTNDEAIRLIKSNNTRPTLIQSIIQRKGRGTMGKNWLSIKGNIFISISFKMSPKLNFKEFAILNPNIIRKVLKSFSTYKITVKWPNDLIIKRKKICGILQETIDYKSDKYLIVGIGINTLHAPINKNFESISLSNCSKIKIKNEDIVLKIKKSYEKLLSDIKKYKSSDLIKRFSKE